MKKKSYQLRPHHGMCLAYFQGNGYNEEFTAHMKEIDEELEENAEVQLVLSGDEICSACPNQKEGNCVDSEKVREYDRAVLRACGWQEGETVDFKELTSKVEQKILSRGKRREICGSCQWDELCKSRNSRWKR